MSVRIRHRDWYVDEGAVDPIQGIMAAMSSTITSIVEKTCQYARGMNKALHKESPEEPGAVNNPPLLEDSASIDYSLSQNPVQKAAGYSPQQLDSIAYMLASKSSPIFGEEKTKHRRSQAWSPTRRDTFMLHPAHRKVEYHGRLYNASVETGNFAYAVIATGLKSEFLHPTLIRPTNLHLAVPVALFYNLANGFHNAPSILLADDTVRRRDTITGFKSGVKVAAKEVAFGLYDGVTGLVTQPYRGARKEGVVGFLKGIGKGVGGLVCKTSAAVFGLPGYTLKGLEKQLEKRHSRFFKASLLVVRIKQGILDFERSTEEEKEEIKRRWKDMGCDRCERSGNGNAAEANV